MINLTAFSQYKIGGVQNYYFNILSNLPKEYFDIHWIFEDTNDTDSKLPRPYNICREELVKVPLHEEETIYGTAKRIAKLIPDTPGIVMANFLPDLAALHLYRKKKRTITFVCHDEYYVPLAQKFEFLIDVFIAHNIQFYHEMRNVMPERQEDIYYLPYGVPIPDVSPVKNPGKLKIILAARLNELKGIYDIPQIDSELKNRGVDISWCIVGDGPDKNKFKELVSARGNFEFFTPESTAGVVDLMAQSHIFILPSRLDGLPVALLESMSVGCVPVISDFNEGIKEVITPSEGFVLPKGDIKAFADAIQQLNDNRNLLSDLSRANRLKAEKEFNIKIQVQKYAELFKNYRQLKKPYRNKRVNYSGYLDRPFVPSFIRKPIRKFKKIMFSKKH
jgi:glycosyltransferase involved in cell wall biosynthesis